jgi:hypothetical protein
MVGKTNLQLQSIISEDRQIEERLPQLEKKLYTFEANNQTEPSRLVAQFVERCIKCIEQGKGNTPSNQMIHSVYIVYFGARKQEGKHFCQHNEKDQRRTQMKRLTFSFCN